MIIIKKQHSNKTQESGTKFRNIFSPYQIVMMLQWCITVHPNFLPSGDNCLQISLAWKASSVICLETHFICQNKHFEWPLLGKWQHNYKHSDTGKHIQLSITGYNLKLSQHYFFIIHVAALSNRKIIIMVSYQINMTMLFYNF